MLTDRSLAILAADGNENAANALIARHRDSMCRVVAGVAGSGPAAAAAASAALATARSEIAAGLPLDRAPRLSLLGTAYACAAGADAPQAAMVEGVAQLDTPCRAALVLTATLGLPAAGAALVMGTTGEHVGALIATAEAELTAFPPAGPACLDARSETPPAGALAAHAAGCPSCSAFAVERAERGRRLAAVLPVAPTVAFAGGASGAVATMAPPWRIPRVELAVIGTVSVAVATVGITLGTVLTSPPSLDVPAPSAEELRPRTVPEFPEVASDEDVRLVTRLAAPGSSGPATARVRFRVAPLVATDPPGSTPPSPQPSPPAGSGPVPDVLGPEIVGTPRGAAPAPDVAVKTPSPSPVAAPVSSGPRASRDGTPKKRTKLPPAVTPPRVVAPPAAPPPAPAVAPPAPVAPPQAAPPPRSGPDRGHDDDHGHGDDHGQDRDHDKGDDRGNGYGRRDRDDD